MKTTKVFFLINVLLINLVYGQISKGDTNALSMSGENFKKEAVVELSCSVECFKVDKEAGTLTFTLTGMLGEKNVIVLCELPILKGTKKIKVDKDGDLPVHQMFSIEIHGNNPSVDKDLYEVQEENDAAVITIINADPESGELEGSFTAKYIDSATGNTRLNAGCHFFVKRS